MLIVAEVHLICLGQFNPLNLEIQSIILFYDRSSDGISSTTYHSFDDFGSIH
jgi:hypothetical protein